MVILASNYRVAKGHINPGYVIYSKCQPSAREFPIRQIKISPKRRSEFSEIIIDKISKIC